MKVGDLVELSAKGKVLKCCGKFVGLLGIVSGKDRTNYIGKPTKVWYYVDWCGGDKNVPHLRSDLKHVSK